MQAMHTSAADNFMVVAATFPGDTMPHITPAGTASVVDPEGAKAAFHPTSDENARPGTPPEIAKFRKSTLHVPGRKVVHPGMANDPTVDHVTHGAKTVPSEPVQSVLQSQYPTNPVLLFQRQRAEEIYASATREPLGATYKRGHVLPKGLGTETGFGVKSEVNPTSSVVKDMVFPTEIESIMLGDANTSDAHAMYVKSHGNYAPGERRDRGYDWNAAGVNLGTTRFGRSTKPDALETMQRLLRDQSAPAATVEQTINPLKDATKRNAVTGAVIVDLKSETARAMNWDPLGRSKPLGTGITVDPFKVHGAPSRTRDDNGELEWDAKRLLAGDYSVEDQAPDPQIGKSMTRQGYAYEPASVLGTDDGRTFGVPSTRRDLAPPKMRSVADEKAYGDEASASGLINPGYGSERGVTSGDFSEVYDKDSLRSFYEDVGVMGPDTGSEEDVFFSDVFFAAASDDFNTGKVGVEYVTTLGTFQKTRVRAMARAMRL